MILRPCKKCLVRTVCKAACPQIRRRKKIFEDIETIVSILGVIGLFLMFFMLIAFNNFSKETMASFGNIIMYIIGSCLISGMTIILYTGPKRKEAVNKFPELAKGTLSDTKWPPQPRCKPKITPPPPPKKRYITH